jgi:hypothetical protein
VKQIAYNTKSLMKAWYQHSNTADGAAIAKSPYKLIIRTKPEKIFTTHRMTGMFIFKKKQWMEKI